MPLKIWIDGKVININPSARWTSLKLDASAPEITVDKDYYVAVLNIMGK